MKAAARRVLVAAGALALAGCQWLSGATAKTLIEPAGGAGGAPGGGSGGGAGVQRSKVDLLLVVDNSVSMKEKQQQLASVVEDMIDRLLYPPCISAQGQLPWTPEACQAGTTPAFPPLTDLHLGVITSSLGGHGSDICETIEESAEGQSENKNFTQNDRGRLIRRGPRPEGASEVSFPEVQTWNGLGFLAWSAGAALDPLAETEASLKAKARALVLGADQIGCGYEAPLEAWYRFLVEPAPGGAIKPGVVAVKPEGPSVEAPKVLGLDRRLLEQRAAFLRPDSLVGILLITDENDCSVIDGVLPEDVCDTPISGPGSVDDDGNPTGCSGGRVGWPPGYVEGNFHDITKDDQGRVSGAPFPVNFLALLQRVDGAPFSLTSGTKECADDPHSPACTSCYTGGQGCKPLDGLTDPIQLRCWDQKRRFGVDMLYPIQRYVDGLSKPAVYNRDGYLVPNPLFAGGRTERDVFLAAVVGVPWQDIARNPDDLTSGYKPTVATAEASDIEVDWGLILGDRSSPDPVARRPADPLMIESSAPRSGAHPITGEVIGPDSWNSINGREKKSNDQDLQFACVFDLQKPIDCSETSAPCDCNNDDRTGNPLCEEAGVFSTTQRRAKAYPAPRVLQLIKGLGGQGILTSICTPNVTDPTLSNYAYRPATRAIAEALSSRLKAP